MNIQFIEFPHGRPKQVPVNYFLAGWKTWFDHFGPPGAQANSGIMPISAEQVVLEKVLAKGRLFSLDVLCRMLVASRNTKQASREFRQLNSGIIETAGITVSSSAGKSILGARLTPHGQELLNSVTTADITAIEALRSADVEDASLNKMVDVVGLDPAVPLNFTHPSTPYPANQRP